MFFSRKSAPCVLARLLKLCVQPLVRFASLSVTPPPYPPHVADANCMAIDARSSSRLFIASACDFYSLFNRKNKIKLSTIAASLSRANFVCASLSASAARWACSTASPRSILRSEKRT
jgi:hypothetical protein